uniref:Uncharacterized protein n=1 Tax=Ciona intestinalis TaxID=7719 RepID=H2XWS1_CIOIN
MTADLRRETPKSPASLFFSVTLEKEDISRLFMMVFYFTWVRFCSAACHGIKARIGLLLQ